MSLIQALNDRRSPYTTEGRTHETLVDELGMLAIAHDKLRGLFEELIRDFGRATNNLQTSRKRIFPSDMMERFTEIMRISEERGETIDFIIDLCYILKLDSSDLLEEFWRKGENT